MRHNGKYGVYVPIQNEEEEEEKAPQQQLVKRIENVEEKRKKLRASKHRIENLRVISFKSNFNLTCDTLDATQV